VLFTEQAALRNEENSQLFRQLAPLKASQFVAFINQCFDEKKKRDRTKYFVVLKFKMWANFLAKKLFSSSA
jgi:hypothetical protein